MRDRRLLLLIRVWFHRCRSTLAKLYALTSCSILRRALFAVSLQRRTTWPVIFTSGSTGRPKGVQIQHRAVVNFLSSMRREPGIRPTDVLLAVTTLSFDIAGLELFLPLTSGASLVIATRETVADGKRLREELETRNITLMQATPVTWTCYWR